MAAVGTAVLVGAALEALEALEAGGSASVGARGKGPIVAGSSDVVAARTFGASREAGVTGVFVFPEVAATSASMSAFACSIGVVRLHGMVWRPAYPGSSS